MARRKLLEGLFAFRSRLRQQGMSGVQWLDGSFVGDVESREMREPGDIDVVTFWSSTKTQRQILADDPGIANNKEVRATHGLDSYLLGTDGMSPALLLNLACYWHGMWSRSKLGSVPCMKGYLALRLDASDVDDVQAIREMSGKVLAP